MRPPIPKQTHEADVVAEHHAGERRVLAEHSVELPTSPTGLSVLDSLNAIRDAARCTSCGKTRAVINLGAVGHRRRIQPELVSLATHCSCPGGPAHSLVNASQERAS